MALLRAAEGKRGILVVRLVDGHGTNRRVTTWRSGIGLLGVVSLYHEVAAALTEPNLDQALEQTLRLLAQALALDAAWVWLLDEGTSQFYLAAAYDLPPYLREPLHMTGEPCWCMQAFFAGDFVTSNVDVIACSRLQEGIDEVGEGATRGLRSHASVSLRFGDRALGLLNVARARNPSLAAQELDLLAAVGAQVGVAVERSRLAERAASSARLEERASLARELHDTVVQELAAIALQLESAQRKAKTQPNEAAERIATALELARKAMDELRGNVEGLRSDPLAGESLIAALSRLARKFTSETGVQVALNAGDAEALGADLERAVYRIVAEGLTNVRRHARARRVEVRVERLGDEVVVHVSDDGVGFDPAAGTTGFGLRGIRERAAALGGTLGISTPPNGGTTLDARFPVSIA